MLVHRRGYIDNRPARFVIMTRDTIGPELAEFHIPQIVKPAPPGGDCFIAPFEQQPKAVFRSEIIQERRQTRGQVRLAKDLDDLTDRSHILDMNDVIATLLKLVSAFRGQLAKIEVAQTCCPSPGIIELA